MKLGIYDVVGFFHPSLPKGRISLGFDKPKTAKKFIRDHQGPVSVGFFEREEEVAEEDWHPVEPGVYWQEHQEHKEQDENGGEETDERMVSPANLSK